MCAAALSTDPAQTGRTLTTSRLSSLYFSQHLICLTLINLVPTSKTHLSSRCPHGPCTTSPSTPVVRVGRPSSAPFVQRKCRLGGEMPHPSSHNSQVRPLPHCYRPRTAVQEQASACRHHCPRTRRDTGPWAPSVQDQLADYFSLACY